jgi:hypothetical protein
MHWKNIGGELLYRRFVPSLYVYIAVVHGKRSGGFSAKEEEDDIEPN